MTVPAAANNSSPISQNYAAGATITFSISTAGYGCTTIPANANLLDQYKIQGTG